MEPWKDGLDAVKKALKLCFDDKTVCQESHDITLHCAILKVDTKDYNNTCNMSRVMRKLAFCLCENKDADQLCVTAQLISTFVFAT